MATLNHIGIAVADLPEIKRLLALLGFSIDHTEDVPDQGVKTHFIPMSRTNLELLEPTGEGAHGGAIGDYIKKHGPGIHHLAFGVPKGEFDALCSQLKAEGYRLIYDTPRAGAQGARINFIHPASAGGMLIEIMEAAKKTE